MKKDPALSKDDRNSRRPQQHVRRDEAVAALTTVVLANGWLFRKRDGDDDYGIDGDVEVFLDEDTTGLEFPVQVKGTAKLKGRPRVRVEWKHWDYWRAQVNPVLVVLWEKATGTIWWEWNHRFDTTGLDRQTKEFTFRFPEDQVWDPQTPSRLLAEVTAWRSWDQYLAHLPASVVVQSSGELVGISTQRIVGRLRQRTSQVSDLLELRRDHPGDLRLDIHISNTETAIWVSGGPSVVIHHEDLDAKPLDPDEQEAFIDEYTANLLIGMSKHLVGIGARTAGARVAEIGVEDAVIIFDPEMGLGALALLLEQQRWDGVQKLLVRLLLAGDEVLAQMALRVLDEMYLDEEACRRLGETFRLCVRGLETSLGDTGRAARLSYNASVALRSVDPNVKFDFLNEAARLDPAYETRSYWWRETGGCLFLLQDHEGAVERYWEALQRGEPGIRPLLADALMFAGRYGEALSMFENAFDEPESGGPEWRLKHHLLEWLVATTGITEQNRDPAAVEMLLESEDVNDAALTEAVRRDALHPDALWRLGHHLRLKGERSVDAFIGAAVMAPNYLEPWAYAVAFAGSEAPELLHDVASHAKRHIGNELVSDFQVSDAPTEVVTYIEELFDHVEVEQPPPLDIRIAPTGSASYDLIPVGDPAWIADEEE
jgi:tetratricopeptide (TPR) repeat protein